MSPTADAVVGPDDADHYVVILAGGRGERFWPVSREATPKQLISLIGEGSFLQQAVARVAPVVSSKNTLVITNVRQVAAVRDQLPQLPAENIIGEPLGRNTCAAVALGAAVVGARNERATFAVLPADHVIPEPAKFQRILADALSLASQKNVLVTIGIHPTAPETGYGYIEVGESLTTSGEPPSGTTRFSKALRFVEKPDLETAKGYLSQGRFLWNAGIFVWSFAAIRGALFKYQPEIAAAAQKWQVAAAVGSSPLSQLLEAEYPQVKRISIDYGVMQSADNVVVADGDFDWDDLGSWPALARHFPKDANQNVFVGSVVAVGASGNIVFDARTGDRTPITLVGVQDSIVVVTGDAMLVANKNDAQRIAELVKILGADPRLTRLT